MGENKTEDAFRGLYLMFRELLDALEWVTRDGADQDDCLKARAHVKRARAMADRAEQIINEEYSNDDHQD